jgi:hypothetical protein
VRGPSQGSRSGRSARGSLPLAAAPLALLALASAGCRPWPGAGPPPSRLVLADFEGEGHEDGGWSWSALPDDAGDRAHLEAAADPLGERPGRVLHVEFAFADADPGPLEVRVAVGDVDASGFDHLAFWIRGDGRAGFGPSLKIRLLRTPAGEPLQTGSAVVDGIDERWQRVLVPLNRMPGLRARSHLRDFLVLIQPRRVRVARGGYFLDRVELLRTGDPGPSALDPVPTPRKRAWEREARSPEDLRRRQQQRLVGWPALLRVDPRELPTEPEALLRRMAGDVWRGLDALTDRESGLPVDNVRLAPDSVAAADARIGDFTNVTNVGLHLMAIAAAHDLGLLPRDAALARVARVLDTLERLESHRGFFFNYYDTTSLERSSDFVSFVDSAWLGAGLLLARSAFPELEPRCTRLVERGDYALFYDPVEQRMSHGMWASLGVPSEYHYGVAYTEARLGSLLAVAKGDVPEEHWRQLARRFAALASDGGALRRWRGIAFLPSWGGSMFEALMPVLVVDEPRLAAQTLGRNDEAHAVIQRRYAEEELRYAVWGMSPSATPGHDGYGEYGAPPLGLRGYSAAAVAPYAAGLALAVSPEAATGDLGALACMPGVYGDYGPYDAVDPRTGEVATAYLALDQSMLFLALANHLDAGCVRRRFAEDPIVHRALALLADGRTPQ